MSAENPLSRTASLFLALADRTRLRLLNLMRDREVCVSSFTGTLGQSQPKISRHLAYLRNAGVVEVRRDGKWMYYSISARLDGNTSKLLFELFKWMQDQDTLLRDREKYSKLVGDAEPAPQPPTSRKAPAKRSPQPRSQATTETPPPVENEWNEPEVDWRPAVHHNELEDFLL